MYLNIRASALAVAPAESLNKAEAPDAAPVLVLEIISSTFPVVSPATVNFVLGVVVPIPTFPFPNTENLVPPTKVYATLVFALVMVAVVIEVSDAIAEMATVCPPFVMVSLTLNVFRNCVPTPVTVVPPAVLLTVPTPAVP